MILLIARLRRVQAGAEGDRDDAAAAIPVAALAIDRANSGARERIVKVIDRLLVDPQRRLIRYKLITISRR
jgi:hypothetical protein